MYFHLCYKMTYLYVPEIRQLHVDISTSSFLCSLQGLLALIMLNLPNTGIFKKGLLVCIVLITCVCIHSSGIMRSGVNAIMGPSGSGKST